MKKICLLLSLILLLSGCGTPAPIETEPSVPETTEETVFRFPDGDPNTVTALGSYSSSQVSDAVIARIGDVELTNRELQAWYWAEVAQYRQSGGQGLEMSLPLDQQECPIDDSVLSWQQYFLKQALNTWHTVHALLLQAEREGVPVAEPTYDPIPGNYEKYMDGMPATAVLEGYEKSYRPNSMHQSYLDALPETLEAAAKELGYANDREMARIAMGSNQEDLLAFARDYNRAYMYFTSLSYLLEPEKVQILVEPSGENVVTFRHILCTGDSAMEEALALLEEWDDDWLASESTFAGLAYAHSQDPGSASKGGLYRRVAAEQIPVQLAQWCLAPERTAGDTTVLQSDHGVHAVYFAKAEAREAVRIEEDMLREQEAVLIQRARESYPLEVSYPKILLLDAEGSLSKDRLLYPDLAHERFPEVPLYLQQDYPGVMYGGYRLQTNGCGITSFAMLASYMADEAYTPPYMCARYGRYSSVSGTDSGIFRREGGALECYLLDSTYDWREAREYMEQGYPCIVLQHQGYWTRGGHYLVLEKMNRDGSVQVRDSNLYNYFRIREGHALDWFTWDVIHPASAGYWIFAQKDITTPACTRCGTGDAGELCSDYLCKKCQEAIVRRETYLTGV